MIKSLALLSVLLIGSIHCTVGQARDYFLTLGGGYSPQGNQASLEANVLFFQRLLRTKQLDGTHRVYFADGFDGGQDLQVLQRRASKPNPALKTLSDIFRIQNRGDLIYRNHEVPSISGGLRVGDIRSGLDAIGKQLTKGDRLFVYVTAHGGASKEKGKPNTSISCWGNKPLTMQEFSGWLDELPEDVTVVSVMAQCYCGGFANTIFEEGDAENGFSKNVRCGFFAQQADLPAAGCRPDVENDEEYSSYFWGAFVGESRTGKPVGKVDCDSDGRVSLAEAHAFAVLASETIDIPLRTSDTLLRRYSRLTEPEEEAGEDAATDSDRDDAPKVSESRELVQLTGSIYEVASRGRPDQTRVVVGLAEKLELPLTIDVSEVTKRYEVQRNEFRDLRRSGMRRPRGATSPRRRMQEQVVERWPELEDPKAWPDAEVLSVDKQDEFLAELEKMEGFQEFVKSVEDRQKASDAAEQAELKQVKFRRLIQQLESIVLAQNLPTVASPEVVERYQMIVKAEEGFLGQ